MNTNTYCAHVWDHEANAWEQPPRYAGVSLWGLRTVIRELRSEAWDEVSVLIAREEPEPESERSPHADA